MMSKMQAMTQIIQAWEQRIKHQVHMLSPHTRTYLFELLTGSTVPLISKHDLHIVYADGEDQVHSRIPTTPRMHDGSQPKPIHIVIRPTQIERPR